MITRSVITPDQFTEATADSFSRGDGALVRYYDGQGAYVEEIWFAEAVSSRRYGKGTRVTITWSNGRTESYRARKVLGKLI